MVHQGWARPGKGTAPATPSPLPGLGRGRMGWSPTGVGEPREGGGDDVEQDDGRPGSGGGRGRRRRARWGRGGGGGECRIPTCTVTAIRMVASPASAEPGVELLAAGGFSGCFGAYGFLGVTPKGLGYQNVTTDNYAELAAVLKHWNSIDGVPGVAEWVNLSSTVAAGMKAAGINPTMFLQWINEYDGAGTVYHPAMPPTWPPFLPKALVSDPATIVGGTADQAAAAPKATPPP